MSYLPRVGFSCRCVKARSVRRELVFIYLFFQANSYSLEKLASKLSDPQITLLVCKRSKKLKVKHRLRTNVPS